MPQHYGSEATKGYVKRLPLYFGIFLLTLIPFKIEPPQFDADKYTISELLSAQAKPKIGQWMVYLYQGHTFFGRIERIETEHVWLRDNDRGIWCPYESGIWISFNQLLSVVKEGSKKNR